MEMGEIRRQTSGTKDLGVGLPDGGGDGRSESLELEILDWSKFVDHNDYIPHII